MKNSNYMSKTFKNISGLFQKNLLLRNIKGIMYYIDSILLLFLKKPKNKLNKKKRILIIYNLAFGDGVIWRCSSIHLRELYPKEKYELILMCQKGINKLYENDNTYDKIISIDFNKSTVNLKERIKNFKEIRKNYYDYIIDPTGIHEWTTNIFYVRAAVGNKKIGYIDNNVKFFCSRKKINKIYDEIIENNGKKLSLLEYYSFFINKLSNDNLNIKVGFEKLITIPNKINLPSNYYIIFPSASMKLKKWHIDRYVKIAEKIYNKTKMELVLVGTASDLESINEFKSLLKVPYIDLVEKTSLNDYIDIIKNASLVITNDTSAYHIAVIEEVPVAIITGGYTYYRYVEYSFERENEFRKPCIIVHEMNCFDCGNRCKKLNSSDTNWPCLEKITVDYAWKKIEKLIDDNNIGG